MRKYLFLLLFAFSGLYCSIGFDLAVLDIALANIVKVLTVKKTKPKVFKGDKKGLGDSFDEQKDKKEGLSTYVKERVFDKITDYSIKAEIRDLFELSWLTTDENIREKNKNIALKKFEIIKPKKIGKKKKDQLLYALEAILVVNPLMIDEVITYMKTKKRISVDSYKIALDVYDIINKRVALSIDDLGKTGKKGGSCLDLLIALQYPVKLASLKSEAMAKADLFNDEKAKNFLKNFDKQQKELIDLLALHKANLKNSCAINIQEIKDILTLNEGRIWCRSEFPADSKEDEKGAVRGSVGGKDVYYQKFDKELARVVKGIVELNENIETYPFYKKIAEQKILTALNAFGAYITTDKYCSMCLSGDISNIDMTNLIFIEKFLNKLVPKTYYVKQALKNIRLIKLIAKINASLSTQGLAGALDGVAVVRYFLDKNFVKKSNDPCSEDKRKKIIKNIENLLNGMSVDVFKDIKPLLVYETWRDVVGEYQYAK